MRSGRELVDRVERLAGALACACLGGERIGLWLENSFAAFEAYLGGWPLTILDQDDHTAIAAGRADRAGSCGRKLCDPAVELRLSAAGELCARSPMTVAEYCDAEGWCGLGDLARIDADGYVFLRGRLDSMVNTGYHIYPEEVEEALVALPGVAAAQVVGQPDVQRGQILTGFVVAKPGSDLEPERVREVLRERLAPYKVPRVIWIVDALTHTNTNNPWRSPDELNRPTPSRDAR